MSNEKREEQMMNAAEAYAAGCYADEPVSFSTEENICETINDFCAGWRAADRCSQWIPVEKRLPAIDFDTGSTWDFSDDVYVHTMTGSCRIGRYEYDKLRNEFYWVLYGIGKDIPVTHWMPLPAPPKKGGEA